MTSHESQMLVASSSLSAYASAGSGRSKSKHSKLQLAGHDPHPYVHNVPVTSSRIR